MIENKEQEEKLNGAIPASGEKTSELTPEMIRALKA